METDLHGVSTRKVDDLVKALGADSGMPKSEVSRICADCDEKVAAFRNRPLSEIAFRYVFHDATYCKARVKRRMVSQAVVIATGVAADGHRELLGFAVGDSEDGPFSTALLCGLAARGLTGTQPVISDAHAGLKGAIEAVLLGAVICSRRRSAGGSPRSPPPLGEDLGSVTFEVQRQSYRAAAALHNTSGQREQREEPAVDP